MCALMLDYSIRGLNAKGNGLNAGYGVVLGSKGVWAIPLKAI